MATIRTTKLVPLDSIQTHPDNPNRGDTDAISVSLKHHGQYRAIVVSEATGNILAGNHTYLAAQLNGETKMLAHLIPGLSPDDEVRIMVADNQYARLAHTDDEILSGLLVDLQASDDGLLATGYDPTLLDGLLASLDPASDNEGREGEVTEPPVEPTTKLGDVWQLGEHTLVCGDAFDVVLEGDCIITDPPYGITLETNYAKTHPGGRRKDGGPSLSDAPGRTYRPVIGDDTEFDPTPLLSTYKHIKEQLWFGGDYYMKYLPDTGTFLVWDKRDTGDELTTEGTGRMWGSHFELIWSAQKHQRVMLRFLWFGLAGGPGDNPRNRFHPTQKPIPLMERLIEVAGGTVILDLFGGSGSTLIAADNLDRICHTVEIDPAYCDVIIHRWESLDPDNKAIRL